MQVRQQQESRFRLCLTSSLTAGRSQTGASVGLGVGKDGGHWIGMRLPVSRSCSPSTFEGLELNQKGYFVRNGANNGFQIRLYFYGFGFVFRYFKWHTAVIKLHFLIRPHDSKDWVFHANLCMYLFNQEFFKASKQLNGCWWDFNK